MTKKQIKNISAAKLMESFIENGQYQMLKKTEKDIKSLTAKVREQLEKSESKRHEFTNYNLVGRFTAKKIYEVDLLGLNEYLYNLGLLTQVVDIDAKRIKENVLYHDLIQEFKLPDTYYVKPSFNKLGKEAIKGNDHLNNEIVEDLNDIMSKLKDLKPQLNSLNYQYDGLKKELLDSNEIKELMSISKEKRKSIAYKFGSISLVSNTPKYDIPYIYDCLGEGLLIDYGKPNSALLDTFITNGTITQKEIDQFRVVKDIRLDFSIMTLEDESKMLGMLDRKQKATIANRILA